MYLLLQDAVDWAVDDPRLVGVADRLVEIFDQMEDAWAAVDPDADAMNGQLATLLDRQVVASFPPLARLAELLEERGYSGWTDMKRVDDSQ